MASDAPSGVEYWAHLSSKLPAGKDASSKVLRKSLFNRFDMQGNGFLSLAEVDKGIRDHLNAPELFEKKPVVMRAFQAAKTGAKNTSEHSNDYVEHNEFRLLLVYLREYLEFYVMFDEIDVSNDRRVDFTEFSRAQSRLADWGVTIKDAKAVFDKIDANRGGHILFDEFADWAAQQRLDLEDDDDALAAPVPRLRNLAAVHVDRIPRPRSASARPAADGQLPPRRPPLRASSAKNRTGDTALAGAVERPAAWGKKQPQNSWSDTHRPSAPAFSFGRHERLPATRKSRGRSNASSLTSESGAWAFQHIQRTLPTTLDYTATRHTGAANGVSRLAGCEPAAQPRAPASEPRPSARAYSETSRSVSARTNLLSDTLSQRSARS